MLPTWERRLYIVCATVIAFSICAAVAHADGNHNGGGDVRSIGNGINDDGTIDRHYWQQRTLENFQNTYRAKGWCCKDPVPQGPRGFWGKLKDTIDSIFHERSNTPATTGFGLRGAISAGFGGWSW